MIFYSIKSIINKSNYLITSKKAHTLIEMMLSITIFSLLLVTIFMVLNIGLKSWQLGEMSSSNQQAAEVAMQRITGELKISNRITCTFDKANAADPDYICFESPMDGEDFKTDSTTKNPLWQSHIIYYILPCSSDSEKNILYRRVMPHASSVIAIVLNNLTILSYLTPDEIGGEKPRVIVRDVEKFEIKQGEGNLIHITLVCARTMDDKKLAYEQDFNRGVKASITVSTSIRPRN